jgi:hypothetical protein
MNQNEKKRSELQTRGKLLQSLKFGAYYEDIAAASGCHFHDAGKIISASKEDRIHFDAREHAKLGSAVADKVMEIFGIYF